MHSTPHVHWDHDPERTVIDEPVRSQGAERPRTAVTAPSTDPAYEHFHRWELLRFRWDLTGPFDAGPMVDWGCVTCGLVVAAHHQPEARGGAR